jgi:cytochrome P450
MTALEHSRAASPDELLMLLFSDPAVRADPYPVYHQLREMAPVHRSEVFPLWVVSSFDGCGAVLRDPRFGKSDEAQRIFGSAPDAGQREVPIISRHSMLRANPPDHTRLRGLVSREFTPRRVTEMRPAITGMVDVTLDDLAAHGGGDVMDVLAFPLPVRVIGELLGIPAADRDQFRTLVRDAAAALEPMTSREIVMRAERASEVMNGYFRALIATRRRDPSDDLISALIGLRDDGDRLSEDELVATIVLLFAAGFETTTNLIGNGLAALLAHPEEMERLRAEPALMPNAVEEMLRFEPSVQLDARTALVDADVGGIDVSAGEVVLTLLGAANRDPARYPEPDRFDVARTGHQHLAFAAGIHFCLGAPLARLEGEIVFERLLSRFSRIEGDASSLRWRPSLTLRGLESLEVVVS